MSCSDPAYGFVALRWDVQRDPLTRRERGIHAIRNVKTAFPLILLTLVGIPLVPAVRWKAVEPAHILLAVLSAASLALALALLPYVSRVRPLAVAITDAGIVCGAVVIRYEKVKTYSTYRGRAGGLLVLELLNGQSENVPVPLEVRLSDIEMVLDRRLRKE